MTTFLMTAYVAAHGSHFFNGEPGVYNPAECILAAPASVPMGTVYELLLDGVETTCVVKDRIGRPLSSNHLDLLFPTRGEAITFGKQTVQGTRTPKSGE